MPKSVWWFEKLAWGSLLLGSLVSLLDWKRLITNAVHRSLNTRIPIIFLEREYNTMSFAMGAVAIITIIMLLILIWLTVRRRKNWARWVYAVSLAVPLATLLRLPDMLSANPTVAALSIIQGLLQIATVVMLFLPSARVWFAPPPSN